MPELVIKKLKINLAYKFSNEELLELGKTLGEAQLALRQLDVDRKTAVDLWKSRISNQEAVINDLSNKASTGQEYRDVDCEARLDQPIPGKKIIRRMDTLEVVKVIDMDDSEKQGMMALE